MNRLPRPELGASAKEIFQMCVSGFSDNVLKENLLSFSGCVETDSQQFVESFYGSLHLVLRCQTNDREQIKYIAKNLLVKTRRAGNFMTR